MVKGIYKKGLVVGIILLFIYFNGLTSVSSKDVFIFNKTVLKERYDTESVDNNKESITFIIGLVNHYEYSGGFDREAYFESAGGSDLKIFGIKKSSTGSSNIFFKAYPMRIDVPFFIGFVNDLSNKYANVFGIAIGDIEWSW